MNQLLLLLLLLSSILVLLGPTDAVCAPRNAAGKFHPSLGHAKVSPHKPSTQPRPVNPAPPRVVSHPSPRSSAPVSKPTPTPTPPTATNPTTPSARGGAGATAALPGPAVLKLKAICTQLTDFPDLCVSTLTPYLAGQASVDDRMALLQASITAAINETNGLIGLLTQYEGQATNPTMKTSLVGCKNDFSNVLDDIKMSTDAIPARDYGTLTNYLGTAITHTSDCDDEFWGLNPLQSQNKKLKDMFDNCLAFAESVNWR